MKENIAVPLEIHFPLSEKDLINLIKGVEYNQIRYLSDGNQIRIKVYSADKIKHISLNNWIKIVHASYSNPALMDLIHEIESGNE